MFAVIPHPTEALILSRTQKATLSRLNAEAGNSRWIPIFPLWAFFNNFDYRTQQLKTIRDAIASFTISVPEISNGEFFFPAVLRFRNGETVRGKILAGKKTDDDADSPRACENEKKLFARFPYSCSVFRIADAEIGERKTANDENEADKIADKCAEDTSANSGDTDDAELRTWRVHTSLWVKTEKRYRKTANDASNTSYRN